MIDRMKVIEEYEPDYDYIIELVRREWDISKEYKFMTNKKGIFKWYLLNEHHPIVVKGAQGIGKTVYALKDLYDLYGSWEVAKALLFYHPLFVVRLAKRIKRFQRETGIRFRLPAIIMDDAQKWLNKRYYRKAWIQEFLNNMSMLRNIFSTIILTTPSEKLLLKDVREAEGLVKIKIEKTSDDIKNPQRYRQAKAYMTRERPDGRHYPVGPKWIDRFTALLPDHIYKKWYMPLRDRWEEIFLAETEETYKREEVLGYQVEYY